MTEPDRIPDSLIAPVIAAYNALLDRTTDRAKEHTMVYGDLEPSDRQELLHRRAQLVALADAMWLSNTVERDLAAIDAALALPDARTEAVHQLLEDANPGGAK